MTAYDLGQLVGPWLGAVEKQCPAPRLAPALSEPSARLKTRDCRLPANGSRRRAKATPSGGSPFEGPKLPAASGGYVASATRRVKG